MARDRYVLLLDESEPQRVQLESLLRRREFIVVGVAEVSHALNALKSFHFDVLVADVGSCRGSLAALQNAAHNLDTRLFLIGEGEELTLGDAREVLLRKPASPRVVLATLRRRVRLSM